MRPVNASSALTSLTARHEDKLDQAGEQSDALHFLGPYTNYSPPHYRKSEIEPELCTGMINCPTFPRALC